MTTKRDTSRFHRQLGLMDVPALQETPFTVIGAGALGSFITLVLAKMGAEDITVFDDDKVENHNLPMQFYRQGDIGKYKVEALKEIINDFDGVNINIETKKFDGSSDTPVVISAVDSIEARRDIYSKLGPSNTLYIDTRAAGNIATIFTLPWDAFDLKEDYERNLEDDDVYEAPCTERMTTYIAPAVASHVAYTAAAYCSKRSVGPYKRTLDMVNCLVLLEEPET